jgi:hypothetical protein
MSDLKRRPSRKKTPRYPAAREALEHRREFLALLAKGALGAGMLGLIGCDGANDPHNLGGVVVLPEDVVDVMDDVPVPGGIQAPDTVDTQTWDSSGIQPMPDVVDARDDWVAPGGPMPGPDVTDIGQDFIPDGLPPMPDVVDKDSCTVPTDVEGDGFVPLPGEAPMPDTVDPDAR